MNTKMNVAGRRNLSVPGVCLLAILQWGHPVCGGELVIPKDIPEAPGYSSREEVMAQIFLKRLPIIEAPASAPEGVTHHKSVVYGMGGGRELLMDILQPERMDSSRKSPLLIFIHGGSWSGGKREDYFVYTHYFAEMGYVTATVSYRLSGEAPFPAAIEDVKCAIRYLRKQADQYGIDGEKIAVIGGSAGGHLALLAGYTQEDAKLDGTGGHNDISSRVQAVIDFYGPSDLTTDFAKNAGAVRKFLKNQKFEENPELYELASPIRHLDPTDPPTLILHGTLDKIVPIDQSDVLAARLGELKIPYYYDRLEGWPHTMDAAIPVNNRAKALMLWFLENQFGGDSPR
ncbi:MAG: alpha/beta hydrolase [Verrucomicrobia bacterium]|nr:alpha/beta hydrolase [Verrucomicrobiota bacterium]